SLRTECDAISFTTEPRYCWSDALGYGPPNCCSKLGAASSPTACSFCGDHANGAKRLSPVTLSFTHAPLASTAAPPAVATIKRRAPDHLDAIEPPPNLVRLSLAPCCRRAPREHTEPVDVVGVEHLDFEYRRFPWSRGRAALRDVSLQVRPG